MTRFEAILAELDAKQAPDIEYRSAFSSGTRVPLQRSNTWRNRLVQLIEWQRTANKAKESKT